MAKVHDTFETVSTPGGPSYLIAKKTMHPFPVVFRFAKYPDGSRLLQGGYPYTEGFDSGIEWRNLPEVNVDEKGVQIE